MERVVLIAGVAGFLGTNLALKLLRDGRRILGVDNLCTGSEQNLALLLKQPNFEFLKADICAPLRINAKVWQIYNLACPASPPMYQKMPLETLKVCSIGVLNLLELAKEHDATFLQASTSEVYGDAQISPQPEFYWGNVNPVGPRACYDEGKRFAEALVTNFAAQKKIQCKIVRIFNTYGPYMRKDDGRVVSNFILQALSNQPLTIYGDGSQTRSLCFVDDLVDGLIKMMEFQESITLPVNLGRSKECTVLELAKTILKLTNSESKLVFLPLPENDPCRRCPDTSQAYKKLNWRAGTTLDEGLAETVGWFRIQDI